LYYKIDCFLSGISVQWKTDLGNLKDMKDRVFHVYSPDGKILPKASAMSTLRGIGAVRAIKTLEGHQDKVVSAVFIPTARELQVLAFL
jgi:hypothetical protein